MKHEIDMDNSFWRRPKSFWSFAVVAILCVVLIAFNLYQHQQPSHSIIGKWRAHSDPSYRQNHSYNFFVDGTYIEKVRSYQQVSFDHAVWMDVVSYGRYKLSSSSEISLTFERCYFNGKLSTVSGEMSGAKLTITGDRAILGSEPREYWVRIR